MPITLEEIAKATGYSVPTVSRALTNSNYPVNPATRQRIVETAQAMGYKPNLSARSLRTDQTNTIGVIVDDILSPFVPPIVRGIQDYLKAFDYLCLIVNSDWDPELEQDAINTLVSRPVDGIIFVEYSHTAVNEALERSHKPYVFVHRLFGSPVKNSVVPDDHYGAALAVRHLVHLGRRRIAYINGPEGWHSAQRRLAGYKDELAAQNLAFDPALVQPGDWEFEGGYTATQNLLALAGLPTAIFAANDLMALGAINAIQDAGLQVPEDIAVIGYDNRDFTRVFRPRITTISMPIYEMGRMAAELLVKQIAAGQAEVDEIKIKGQLFVRETCGADETQMTPEGLNMGTVSRRILLNKDPDE
ncbi:MAG: LacI family DNA-binding transcriptional regulator [Chloroflexi bacterium]|nr:LacI family DNA-binding transcriptional regulator [Chloroflexota bacterium]